MVNQHNIINGLILCMVTVNLMIFTIPIEDENFFDCDHIIAEFLKGIGFKERPETASLSIPILSNEASNSVPENTKNIAFGLSEYAIPGEWADTRWYFRKNITIDHLKVSSNLIDFPVLIDIYDSDLQKDAQASGNDIMFTDANGSILDYEIEKFDRSFNSTHAHLVAWVKSNLSSTQDSIISMYYGNSSAESQESFTGVWDENYIGVWHLKEEGSGLADEYRDSSQYRNDGQGGEGNSSFVPSRVQGKIGYAQDFNNLDGYYDLIDCGNDSSLNITGFGITLEAWIQHNITPQSHYYGIMNHKGWIDGYSMWIEQLSLKLAFNLPGETHKLLGTSDVTVNTWHHIVATYDGSYMRVYIDGILEGSLPKSDAIKGTSQEQDFWIGHGDQPQDKLWSAEWEGQIDEVRVSNIGRSVEWIETQFANQDDPNGFYSLSSEESYGTNNWAFKVFRFRKNITIDSSQVLADLTNFPVLIELFDTDLHNNDKAQIDGDDILFADELGSKLDYELEFFDQSYNDTHAHLVAWVRIPSLLSTQDTQILMYYGNGAVPSQANPKGVWDNNYGAVWHLGDKSDDGMLKSIIDSTVNDNDGTPHNFQDGGGGSTYVTGIIDGGINFADDDFITVTTPINTDSASILTLSAWIKSNTSINGDIISRGDSYAVRKWPDGRILFYKYDGSSWINMAPEGVNVTGNEYHYIVAGQNSTGMFLYIDGVEVEVNSNTNSIDYSLGNTLEIGRHGNGNNGYNFSGIIDEVRISNVYRSSSWIATEYNNQNNPSTFYTISAEETDSNWWIDKSFNSRRDIIIDQSINKNPLILRPNGVGNYNAISNEYPLSSTHWQLVSDNNDTTYVEENTTNIMRDTYQTEDVPVIIGTINSVTLKIRVISSSTTETAAEIELVTHDQLYTNNPGWHNNSWIEYSKTWTNNPYTNQPWTIAEINDMEIGVELKGETGGNSRCSEVWAEINYTMQEESLLNFPVLIKISDQSFREGMVQPDAGDFMFVDSNKNKLAHEIEFFAQNATHGDLISWVKVPELSLTEDNVISIYYGNLNIENQENPNIVWDSDYMGVWHLSESPSGTMGELKDSTLNNNDGYTVGSMNEADLIESQIGYGLDLDGIDDMVIMNDSTSLDSINNAGTISVWLNILDPSDGDYQRIMASSNTFPDRTSGLEIGLQSDGDIFFYPCEENPDNYNLITNPFADNTWEYVTFTMDFATKNVEIFINGISIPFTVENVPSNWTQLAIIDDWIWGGDDYHYKLLTAIFDEIRVSDVVRSAAWIAIEYTNQYNPEEFCTLGPRLSIESNIIIEETVHIGGAEVTQLTTPSITAVENDLYLLSVSMKPYLDIASVTGLGLAWTEIEDQPSGRSQTGVSVWYAQGNPVSGGVTVNLAAQAKGLAISLSRISGVSRVDPISFTETANTNGIDGSGSGGTDSENAAVAFMTTRYTSLVWGAAATRSQIFTPASDYTKIDVISGNTGGDEARVTTFQKLQSIPDVSFNVNGSNGVTDWAIAGIEINPAIIDICPPVIDSYGLDDPGTGTGTFWAKIYDLESAVEKVDIKINETLFSMSDNGTHWIYQSAVNYYDYYEYQIFNFTDSWENLLEFPSNIKNHTFNYDSIAPSVQDWEYYDTLGPYGTFKANISDSWGVIDDILLNVTMGSVTEGETWAVMALTASGYVNDTIVLGPGAIKFVVIANDTAGNSFTSTEHEGLVPGTNQAPFVENVTLSRSQSAVLLPIYSNDTLYLDYDYYDPDSDPESGTEINWYKNGVLQPAYSNQKSVPDSALIKGDVWNATVRPYDGQTFGDLVVSSSTLIQNTPPHATSVIVSPSSPFTTSTLSVSYTYSDSDADSQNTGAREICWYKNGILQGAYNDSLSIPSSVINKSEEWFYQLRVHDGTNYSSWITSTSVVISNSAPSATDVQISPSTPQTGNGITAIYTYSDADNDLQSGSRIRWYKNGVLQGALNDSLTVDYLLTTKGENWYYTIEPSDGTTFGTLKTSTAVNIGNTAPTASDLTIPLNPTSSDDLSATWTYSDTDNDPEVSWIIKWYKNGLAQSAYENGTSVPASVTAKGEWWNYTLQVFDGEDYSVLYASLSVLISNTPPSVQIPAFTSGTTTSSNDLVATWGYYDYDGDSQQSSLVNITWYQNGVYQSTYDNSTVIPAGTLLRGDTWNYIIQVFDGTDYSLASNSTNRVILNSLATVSNPKFNATTVGTDDDFELDYQYADADGDLEQDALRIVWWFPNGVYNSSYDNVSIIYADNTTTNQFWYYIIRVYDGYAYSNNYTSSAIIIGSVTNTAPWVDNLSINPPSPTKNDNLIASYDYHDAENHNEAGSEIRWYKNGVLQSHLNDSKTIPASETAKGEEWYFTVRPKDGLEFGTMENASIITIGNLIPEASDLNLPLNPPTTANLTATWLYYDADGDPQDSHWLIQWYRNDTHQPAYDNLSRIYWYWTNKSDSWYFTLKVFDGTDYSILYNSTAIIIQNTAPTATNLQLTENPTTADILIASWSYGDVDNDVNQTPLIRWYCNGILLSAFNDSKSIPAANTSKNEFWKYTLKVFDGENYSIVYNSPIRQILNTAPEIVDNLVSISPTSPKKGDDLEVQYQFTDIDEDYQQGTEILWYCNGILQTNYLNSLTVSGTEVVKGDQWKVCVRVSDGTAFSGQDNSSTIIVINTIPTVSSANVYPTGLVYTTNVLIADYEATDADGDPIVDYQIEWINSSSVVDTGTYPYFDLMNLDVPANYTEKGQQWTFRIMVFDGEDWSSWTPAFGITVLNSEPIVENITIIGGLTTNDPIVLSYDFFDPDGDPDDGTIIDWNIVRRLSGSLDVIHGYELIDANELDYVHFAAGDLIWVAITPDDNDGGDTGDMVVSSQLSGANVLILVGNSAPQFNTTLGYPIILADHPDGTTLYTAMYSLFVNYSVFVVDVDSGETEAIYDVDRFVNPEVLYSIVEMIAGTQYRWYCFNPTAGRWELQPDLTSAVVPASALNRDEQWKVGVRPRDRYGYYGNWVNSSSFVVIGNTPPQLTDFWWTKQSFTTIDNISFGFHYFDWDTDAMVASRTFICWFKNGELIPGTENLTTLSYIYFVKGDEISVLIAPYDGTDWAAHNYTNSEFGALLVIANSAPTASNVTLTPTLPYTIDGIFLTWLFTDADGDLEDSDWIIEWRRSGVVVPALANQTSVSSDYTRKGETWQARIWVFDGETYSYAGYYSNDGTVIIIQNTPMEITEIQFPGIEAQNITADHDLRVDWNITDADNDGQVDYAIYWYHDNGSGIYVYRLDYDLHVTSIAPTDLNKDQAWYCIIKVYDGEDWSANLTSNIIYIVNAAPEVTDLGFVYDTTKSQVEPDIRVNEFFVEDEDLTLFYTFLDIDDDPSQIKIEWFRIRNGSVTELFSYENVTSIPAEATTPGEYWFCRITPYDGFLTGKVLNSSIIPIYSRPMCDSYSVTADPSSEGRYLLSVNASDYSFEITEVKYTIVYYDLYSSVLMATRAGATNWTLLFTLDDLSYLNTNVTVVVKCSTRVEDTEFDIYSLYTFTLLLEDKAPPRVIDAYFEKNDEINPTNLTFLALVQEFGSGILEVELFYYFIVVNESGGNGAVFKTITSKQVLMTNIEYNTTGNYYIYAITVKFNHNNSDTDIIYWLSTTDNAGNTNPTAFDIQDYPQRIKDQRFNYTPPGIPEWMLLVAGLMVFIIFMGSIVYIKFIRKPEIVGLDRDLVLSKIPEISETEVLESLDEHSLGIVISFFDQRHGPIPIIVNPEILKDNFTKLVELSDRSFSGTGFSDDFNNEIPSSYDFVITQGIRTSVMSFGYALERPSARGGQENLTLNLLIHHDIFPLVQSFQKPVQQKVHEIHQIMNDQSAEKELIQQKVNELRKYVTYIVLSYKTIYGTTDLIEEQS